MKFVGGYRDYLALVGDERAIDDVLVYMKGESEAARETKLENEVRYGRG